MRDERELGKELLRQNGIEPGELPENGRRELRRMVERDKKRVARMKWATIVAWPLLALVYIVGVVVEIIHPHTVDLVLALPLLVLFSVAVACTVSWYVRSRFVREREIQASLADIAEQLRQLVKDQQADQPKRGGRPGRESGSETDKG